MENASTNGLPPVPPAGQRVLDQTASPEPRFRASQSKRRPVGGANKFAEKIPGFFERIADRFKDWKERRAETALKKAAKGAARRITGGLVSNNFKLVHQGLKQLHNAEQKFPEKGEQVSARVRAAVSAIPPSTARHLQRFAEFSDKEFEPYSDKTTLFHRMLEGLAKIGLVPESYVASRTKRVDALDTEIKQSLKLMQRNYLNNTICHGNIPLDSSMKREVGKLIKFAYKDVSFDQAVKDIVDSVKNNRDPFDKYILHLHYKYGEYNNREFDPENLLQEAVNDGCLEAEYYLACRNHDDKIKEFYIDDRELQIIYSENQNIIESFKKLAEKDHVEAQYKLALIYAGNGNERYPINEESRKEGVKLFEQLAEVGHLPSKDKLVHLEIPSIFTAYRWMVELKAAGLY